MSDQQYPNWVFKRPHWLKAIIGPGKPIYRLPYALLAQVSLAAIRGQKRDVWSDVRQLVNHMPEAPVVEGVEHVPATGNFVILPNHYERQDSVWVGWGIATIAAAISKRRPNVPGMRCVITSTWRDCYLGPRRVDPKRLEWILKRFGQVYDLILMPEDEADTAGRSMALRTLLKALNEPDQIVALHPEAGGFETMITPPAGVGRVLSLIDRKGITCVPVGVWEEGGHLCVRFGEPLPHGAIARLDDRAAAYYVLHAVARLVPPANRGVFADTCDNTPLAPASSLAAVGEAGDR